MKDKRAGPVLYLRSKEIIKISLNFSTIEMDGMLFWSSRRKNAKFIGLGIEAGHIKFASNLLDTTSSTLDIPTGGFVSDGGWHNVHISIDKKTIQLSVDGRPIFTENKRNVDILDIDDDKEFLASMESLFYIGKKKIGTHYFPLHTYLFFTINFKGKLKTIYERKHKLCLV